MNNGIQSELVRGHINTIILRSLFEGDKYGYEIMKEIAARSLGQYTIKEPTLYSSLKRLEKQGLIKPFWSTGASGGGRRKYYTLTNVGKDICLKNQAEWEYSRTLIDSLVSDKAYNLANPAPENLNLKLVKTRVKSKQDDTYDEEETYMEENNNESVEIKNYETTPNIGNIETETDTELITTTEVVDDKNNDTEEDISTQSKPSEIPHSQTIMHTQSPTKSYTEYMRENSDEQETQYDLFKNINIDIDKNIRDYDEISRIYAEKNTSSSEYDNTDSLIDTNTNDLVSRNVLDIEKKLEEIKDEEFSAEQKNIVGFAAQNSSFIDVSSRSQQSSDEMTVNEIILEQKMEEARKTRELEQIERQRIADQEAIMREKRKDETKAEREYKTLLARLLSIAKTSTINDTIINEDAVSMKTTDTAQSVTDVEPQAKQQIKLYEDEDKQSDPIKKIVDFSEIQSRMQREGFKVRTREVEKVAPPVGSYIKIGNLILHTMLIVFAIVIAELSVIFFFMSNLFNFTLVGYLSTCGAALALPILGIIAYLYYRNKNIFDRYKFGFVFCIAIILTAAAFIVSCAMAFLFAKNLEVTANMLTYIVLPAILALNIPIGTLIYAGLHKSKQYLK